MKRGGLLAGAELASVVKVHAVGEVGEAEFNARGFHLGEELIFAVEAAMKAICCGCSWGRRSSRGLADVDRDVVFGGEGEGSG